MKKYNIYYATEENAYEVSRERTNISLDEAKAIVKEWAENDDCLDELSEDGMEYETPGDGLITSYHTITKIIESDDKKGIAEFEELCENFRAEMMEYFNN